MDVAALGCPQVLFVPTPGQPEQEYLAERLQQHHGYQTQAQAALNVEAAWQEVVSFSSRSIISSNFTKNVLNQTIERFLRHLQ